MKNAAVYLHDPVTRENGLINLFQGEAYVGSGGKADIPVTDLRCSGIHAMIKKIAEDAPDSEKERGDFYLLDLGGPSGTYVKGKRVKETYLNSGDVVVIGTTHLLLKTIPQSLVDLGAFQENVPVKEAPTKEEKKEEVLATERNLLQVSLYWGERLLRVKTFRPGAEITIGATKDATFGVTLPDQNIFKLARYKGGQVLLHVPPGASGLVWPGDSIYTLDEIREKQHDQKSLKEHTITLRVGDRADVQIGELTLSFQFVLPPERVKRFAHLKIDKKLLKILSGFFLLYLLFFMFLFFTPSREPDAKKRVEVPRKFRKVLYKAGMDWAKKRRESAVGARLSKEGGRAKGKEGAAKVKKSPPPKVVKKSKVKKKMVSSKEAASKPRVTRTVAPKTAKAAKTVTPKVEQKKVNLNDVFGSTTSKSVVDDVAVAGTEKQQGNTLGALSKGQFARGSSGLEAGGGGQSVGIGQMKGLYTGGGLGAGDLGVKASKGKEIDLEVEEEVVLLGGLDPDVIAAIIKRYLPQIRYCYESQLVKRPEIKGKVLVEFKILGSGKVAKPKVLETTLKDKAVEECILKKVKRWIFPKPLGGGTVDVKYPFLLMSVSGQ